MGRVGIWMQWLKWCSRCGRKTGSRFWLNASLDSRNIRDFLGVCLYACQCRRSWKWKSGFWFHLTWNPIISVNWRKYFPMPSSVFFHSIKVSSFNILACLWICRRWRDSTPRCQLQFRLDSLRICKLLLLLTFPNKFLHTLVPGRSCLKRVFAKIWRDLGVSGGLSGKQSTATSLSVLTLTSQAAASSTHLESG